MDIIDDEVILRHIQELRNIVCSSDGKLLRSRISPEDYFINLSHEAPALMYPEVGISKLVVNICELISNLLLEDMDESKSISKTIVMSFEYYFLVSPMLFRNQGARYLNDVTFMKHFMFYIQSLCKSRTQVKRELDNTMVALELYNPIKEIDPI